MQTTTNYGFKMPEGSDAVNIDDLNYNTALLDKKVKEVENAASNSAAVTQLQKDFNSHEADYVKHPGYAVTTGSSNVYTIILNPAPTTYIDGMGIVVKFHVTSSTNLSKLDVNGLGVKIIKDSLGNAVAAGGLKANTPYTLRYESTSDSFILQGKGGGDSSTEPPLKYVYVNNDRNIWYNAEVTDVSYNKAACISIIRGQNSDYTAHLIINDKGQIITQYNRHTPTGSPSDSLGLPLKLKFTSDGGWICGYPTSQTVSRYNSSGTIIWTYDFSNNSNLLSCKLNDIQLFEEYSIISLVLDNPSTDTKIDYINLNLDNGSLLTTKYHIDINDSGTGITMPDGYMSYRCKTESHTEYNGGNVRNVYSVSIEKYDTTNKTLIKTTQLISGCWYLIGTKNSEIKVYNDYIIAFVNATGAIQGKYMYILDKDLNIVGKDESGFAIGIANYNGQDVIVSYSYDSNTNRTGLMMCTFKATLFKYVDLYEFKPLSYFNDMIVGYNASSNLGYPNYIYIKELRDMF